MPILTLELPISARSLPISAKTGNENGKYLPILRSRSTEIAESAADYADLGLYYVMGHCCRAYCGVNLDIPLGMASKFFLNSAFIYFSLVFLPVCTSVLAVCTPAFTYV